MAFSFGSNILVDVFMFQLYTHICIRVISEIYIIASFRTLLPNLVFWRFSCNESNTGVSRPERF